jgi:hypothetical protein
VARLRGSGRERSGKTRRFIVFGEALGSDRRRIRRDCEEVGGKMIKKEGMW